MKQVATINRKIILLVSLVIVSSLTQAKNDESQLLKNIASLGKHSLNISCGNRAQERMNKGLSLYRHKMFANAEKTFIQMVEKFPNCSMAHWGYALTLLTPRWSNKINHDSLVKASIALELARTFNPNTRREMKLISSISKISNDLAKLNSQDSDWVAASTNMDNK